MQKLIIIEPLKVNLVFSYASEISRVLAEMKNRTSQNLIEKSGLLPTGIESVRP
jgi:hypothetical protein